MLVNYIYDHRTRSNACGVEILLNSDFVIQLGQFFGLFLILALEKHDIRHTDLSALEDIGQYMFNRPTSAFVFIRTAGSNLLSAPENKSWTFSP